MAFNPITEAYTWGKAGLNPTTRHYLRISPWGVMVIEYGGKIILYYILNNRFRKSLLLKLGCIGKSGTERHLFLKAPPKSVKGFQETDKMQTEY